MFGVRSKLRRATNSVLLLVQNKSLVRCLSLSVCCTGQSLTYAQKSFNSWIIEISNRKMVKIIFKLRPLKFIKLIYHSPNRLFYVYIRKKKLIALIHIHTEIIERHSHPLTHTCMQHTIVVRDAYIHLILFMIPITHRIYFAQFPQTARSNKWEADNLVAPLASMLYYIVRCVYVSFFCLTCIRARVSVLQPKNPNGRNLEECV